MRHSALTCCIILQSIIKIFQMVTEILARNEVKLWIRGHDQIIKILENVKDFAWGRQCRWRGRQQQWYGYDNTSTFSLKIAKLNMKRKHWTLNFKGTTKLIDRNQWDKDILFCDAAAVVKMYLCIKLYISNHKLKLSEMFIKEKLHTKLWNKHHNNF